MVTAVGEISSTETGNNAVSMSGPPEHVLYKYTVIGGGGGADVSASDELTVDVLSFSLLVERILNLNLNCNVTLYKTL